MVSGVSGVKHVSAVSALMNLPVLKPPKYSPTAAMKTAEIGSSLCFLRFLLLDLSIARCRAEWISFRVFRVFRGYISGAVVWPAVTASPELLTGDF